MRERICNKLNLVCYYLEMKKIIYIDESNTSGIKFENKREKFIAGGAFAHDFKFIEAYKRLNLYDKNGKLIKGTDIVTKTHNVKLMAFLDLLAKHKKCCDFFFFSFSTKFALVYELTFELFYGDIKIQYLANMHLYEEIRLKYALLIENSETHPLIKNDQKNNFENLREFVFEEVKKLFPMYAKELSQLFALKRENFDWNVQNNHSKAINLLLVTVFERYKNSKIDSLEIVIDYFNNDETKREILLRTNNLSKIFKIPAKIIFKEDDKVDGLKIADLIASIFRKSITEIFTEINKLTINPEYNPNESLLKFHLKIAKSIFNFVSPRIQASPVQRSVYELMHDISWDVFKRGDFKKLLNKKTDELLDNEIDSLIKYSKNIIDKNKIFDEDSLAKIISMKTAIGIK